jgi:hypothetical protein
MRHTNRSVPTLPSGHQPEYKGGAGAVPPVPSLDLGSNLDGLATLHIDDPIPRGTSALSNHSDGVTRRHPATRANGLPPAPNSKFHARNRPSDVSPSSGSRQNSLQVEPNEYDDAHCRLTSAVHGISYPEDSSESSQMRNSGSDGARHRPSAQDRNMNGKVHNIPSRQLSPSQVILILVITILFLLPLQIFLELDPL